MRGRYALVMLDFDGTVVDSGPVIMQSMMQAFAECGLPGQTPETFRKFIGPPPFVLLTEEFGCDEERAYEVIRTYRRIFGAEAWKAIEPYPGMADLLDALHAEGISLAIATSRLQDTTELLLGHLHLRKYFSHISANTSESRDEDKLCRVEEVLAALPTDRAKACLVGDRRFDMKAAMDAAMDGIFAAYGYGSRAEVAPYAPVFSAGNVAALRKYLLEDRP